MPETSRSIQNFYLVYDKLYADFHKELVAEYAQMRGCYMSEYQDNYEQNTTRRDDRVHEMNMAIKAQVEYISQLKSVKYEQKRKYMALFFRHACDRYL